MAGLTAIVDTSELVRIERGYRDRAGEFLAGLPGRNAIAAITVAELYKGWHRAVTAAQRASAERYIVEVLRILPVEPFGVPEAREYARLAELLRERGLTVGAHDLQIAATAMVAGANVITRNAREFAQVPGLGVRTLKLGPPR